MKPTFGSIIDHALEEAPQEFGVHAYDPSGRIPLNVHPDLPHFVAARVLAYYCATAGLPAEMHLSDGLTTLELPTGKVLVLGAQRLFQGTWLFRVPIVPPFTPWVAVGLFDGGGVLWRLIGAQALKDQLLHHLGSRWLLLDDPSEQALGTQELIAALRDLEALTQPEPAPPAAR